jgi:hypothetical protein
MALSYRSRYRKPGQLPECTYPITGLIARHIPRRHVPEITRAGARRHDRADSTANCGRCRTSQGPPPSLSRSRFGPCPTSCGRD